MDRTQIGALIEARLAGMAGSIRNQFIESESGIGHFVVDDLLPLDLANRIGAAFPETKAMRLRKSLRERKLVSAQMDLHDPILEEITYAFQQPAIVEQVRIACGMKSAFPDEHLYAGGISAMAQGHFLNPHLDNSHDKDRERWRVLNLLYYCTPDWTESDGGSLELWPDGTKGDAITIPSLFNRLAVMATHEKSWHSVSPVKVARTRRCVSNYYFSNEPLKASDSFHVTSFRGRPEQVVRDAVLRADTAARMAIRKVVKGGVAKTTHVYRRG